METRGFGITKSGGSGGGGSSSTTISYGVASGTDTYTVTLSPTITSYNTGLFIEVKFTNANATTTPTLNCNSLGAKTIVGMNGVALYAEQITSSGTYYLTYDGTNLVLVSSPNSSSNNISYGVASGTDAYSVTLSPVITSYTSGLLIQVKFTNANTSSTITLNCNSLGAKTVLNANGGVPYIGQIFAGCLYYLTYDGTNLILTNNPYDGDISTYRKTGTATLERWYTSASNVYTTTTVALTKDVLRATPFLVPKAITLDRIAMEITGAGTAGSVVRLGIYSNSNILPTSLVLDAGTIAGDSATFQSISINQYLPAGLYYLAFVHNSAANITFRGITVNTGIPNVLGVLNAAGTANPANLISSTFAYAVLPNPFDNTGIAASGLNVATIAVRLSA